MDRLKGKTILIGKEPGQGRLLVAIIGGLAAAIGAPSSVPNTVSRCKVAEKMAHAKIDVDQSGNMTITNMKVQNCTYVNGAEIASKRLLPSHIVELGRDRYNINIPLIIETAKKLCAAAAPQPGPQPGPPAQPVSIRHLEKVWNGYHDSLKNIKEKQKRINLIRTGCGLFTLCAMPCISFFGTIGFVLTGVGIIGNVYSFVGIKNDNSSDEQEKLAEELQSSYVCPQCGKFLGNISYRLMKQQYKSHKDHRMHCPYCSVEFVE